VNITHEETNTYELPIEDSPAAAEPSTFSKLFWAGAILFAVNVLVAIGIWLSPGLRVNMYGEEKEHLTAAYKPSPFTEVVSTKPVRKPRLAAKLRPVVVQTPPEEQVVAATYASGNDVDRLLDSYSEMPRLSAALTPAVHTSTVEVSPRRVSEREEPRTVVNN
jgi:hypothetical protein